MKLLHGVVAGLVLCGAAWAQDTQHIPIGSKGAALSLPVDWQRAEVSPDLGHDQFVSKRKVFLAVLEHEAVLSNPAEFDKTLALFTTPIELQHPDLVSTNRPFASNKGLDHACTVFTCTVSGIKFSYEIHLVGRDGLYYVFIGWASLKERFTLAGEMRRIVGSLEMPGPDTGWGRDAIPGPVALRTGSYTYKFTVQKSLYTVKEHPDADRLCTLASKDEGMGCHIFPNMQAYDAGELVRQVATVIRQEYPGVRETKRENVTVAGKTCLQVTMVGTNKLDVETFFVTTLIPLEESKYAEVRFVASSKLEWRKPYLDSILQSLEITKLSTVDAFPEVTVKKPVRPLAPAKRALLEASTLLATFASAPGHMRRLPDGTLWGWGYDKAVLAKPGTTNPVPLLVFDDRNYMRRAAYRDGVLWYTGDQSKLMCFKDGTSKTLDGEATLVEVVGKDALLIVREEKPPVVPGLVLVAGSRLILRGANGTERILKKTSLTISCAVPDAAGKKVLVTSAADWRSRPLVGSDTELAVLEIESGHEQPLPEWKTVSDATVAEDGWLVTGQPKDKPQGLYRVTADGQAQLLVSGNECNGVGLTGEDLIYSTAVTRENTPTERNGLQAYRVPLAVVRKEGPAWQPFFGAQLQRIAAAAFERAKLNPYAPDCFATRKPFDDFMVIARNTSRELAGEDLPATPEGVDDLLEDYSVRQDLKTEGMLLLSALLAQSLLEQKATWCDEMPSALWAGRATPGSSDRSAFAVVCAPGAIVAGLLYDEESCWYRPATTLAEEAKGRALVLSGDPEALVAKRYGESDRNLRTALKGGDTNALVSLLKTSPQNTHLRELVYTQLLATRPLEELAQLAGAFASAETPLVDLRIILAAQTARVEKADSAKLIQSLRTAINRFPEEPAFYAMLGSAYEKSEIESSGEYARTCYEAVLRIAPYGPLAQDAKVCVARIDGTPIAEGEEEEEE